MKNDQNLRTVKKGSFLQTIFGRSLGRTLFFSYLAIALIPFSIVGWFGFQSARESIQQNKFDQLNAVSQLKKDYIIAHFADAFKNIRLEAELAKNKEFIKRLRNTMNDSKLPLAEFVKDLRWNLLVEAFGPDLNRSLLRYNFTNIYLIDPDGNVLFSVKKQDDLGTNLLTGRFANTKFSSAVRAAAEKNEPIYSDLENYEVLGNQVAGFIAQGMFDDSNQLIGILAVQVSTQPINAILQDTTGLGETGETYLVGTDLLMRSESRFSEETSVLRVSVDTQATQQWFEKIQGTPSAENFVSYQGYRGAKVLGVYQTLEINGINMALLAEIDQSEAFYPVRVLGNLVAILFSTTGIMVVLLSFYVTVRVVAPLRSLTRWAGRIAKGELDVKEIVAPRNEIGDLSKSFQDVVQSFQEVTNVCQAVSVGDYSQSVELRSDDDILAKSINQMANTLRAVVKQANTIAEGDYSLEILPKSAKDQLAIALSNMTYRLKTISAENEHQQWFKTGQAALSEKLRGEQGLEQLGDQVIYFLCRYLNTDIGAIYFRETDDELRLVATHAFTLQQATIQTLKLGEGLVGQVALKQESRLIDTIPSDIPLVRSSIIEAAPKQILVYPLVYEENTLGVIELAKLTTFSEDELNFVELMAESIAIAFASNQARLILAEMLDQSQQQADALERQQRALKQANEDLELKTKELVTANQYKSDFLARMSHELRTPLNSILILSKTLGENKQKNLIEKQVQHAKVIYSAGSDLLMLINDILDLAKVEAGRMEILIDKVSPQALCDYMSSSFMPIAEDKKVRFVTQLATDMPPLIYTDRQRLEQILRNLISNAFKFTERGSVEVDVKLSDKKLPSLQDERATGRVICFHVKDTGCGIQKDKQELIFEAFRQADSSTSRKYGGTGLGLNISKELAHALGGCLEITGSEPAKGSTFSLYLPEKLLPTENSIIETKNLTEEGRKVVISIEKDQVDVEKEENKSVAGLIVACITNDKVKHKLLDNNGQNIAVKILSSIDECYTFLSENDAKILLVGGEFCKNDQLEQFKAIEKLGVTIGMISPVNKKLSKSFSAIIKIRLDQNNILPHDLLALLNQQEEAENQDTDEKSIDDKVKNVIHHSIFVDKKVLIVDDDMRNIYALNALLEDHGISVVVATSGRESLNILQKNQEIEMVFMDIMMPEMSGIETIHEIRTTLNQDLPVVAVTAQATEQDEKACLEVGANECMVKPISPQKLESTLKKWLS